MSMGNKLAKKWEIWYPAAGGGIHFVSACVITFFTDFRISGQYFDQRELWSSFFALSAGATGILFSVFVFVMAPAAGFVETISKLDLFARFSGFVKNSIFLTILSTVLILPLYSANPIHYASEWFVWLSLFASSVVVMMLLSIMRVIRIFLVWASAN